MKERPIIFKTENVQAILTGRKTQTRRTKGLEPINDIADYVLFQQLIRINNHSIAQFMEVRGRNPIDVRCPYGQVGDMLWVRRNKAGRFIWKKAEADIWLEIKFNLGST